MNSVKREITVPVFLGNNSASRKKSFSFFFSRGMKSVIFDVKTNFWNSLCFFTAFHVLSEYSFDDMLEMTLFEFASEMADKVLILIPADDRYRKFVEERQRSLETAFIISDLKGWCIDE